MVKLDAIDLKILYHLQLNGRISNVELSQKIGLSPAPTLERVKKLEKLNVIQGYHAVINKQKVNLGISVLLSVRLNKQIDGIINSFKANVSKFPQVVECYKVAGKHDFILKVIVKDILALDKFISSELSALKEVDTTETMLIISEVKQNSLLPLNYGDV